MIKIEESTNPDMNDHVVVSFPFSMNRLSLMKEMPRRRYVPSIKSWRIPREDLDILKDQFKDDQIDEQQKSSQESTVEATQASSGDSDEMVINGFEFKTTPFKHQIEAMKYSKDHDKFLLADEQGLGKTKQAIDIAVNKKQKNGFKNCLVVCGVNSLKWNWKKEIRTHSDEGAHILGTKVDSKGQMKDGSLKDRLNDLKEGVDDFFIVTNIESLRKPKQKKKVNGKFQKIELSETQQTQFDILKELEELTKDGTIDMVIFDEIHKAKNSQSQQGKAIHHLKSSFKIALTGTPLMNEPIDLFNILKWLDAEKASFYGFRKRYCVMGGYGNYEVVDYKNMKELQQKLNNLMLRRKKEEVLDLPEKIHSTEYVEMKAKQKQIYNDVLNGVKDNITEIKMATNPLSELIRLRQATGHTGILSDKVQESAKLERLEEIIEELHENDKKAVIFSNWTSMTDRIQETLKGYNPAIVTGETKDREAEVEKFQNDDSCEVIIGTIQAMGTGLTLTEASTVIFTDKPWNRANTEQAEDRAHRIGTQGTVNVITLVAKGTIDERIEEIIYQKGEITEGLVEGKDDVLAKYDKGELVEKLIS